MSEIWASLQVRVSDEIKDSGLLKAVFRGMEFLGFAEDDQLQTLKLGLPNSLSLGIAKNDLQPLIHQQLQQILNRSDVQVKFQASQGEQIELMSLPLPPEADEDTLRAPQVEFKPKWFLNNEYRLDQFVNGEHSDFAYKCIQMVTAAQQPHLRQLFLYGPSGMGKTHLLHALGWQFKKMSPNLNVKVFNADEFINDYHMYVAKKQMAEFRGKYRLKTDVLLIDDVQSMSRAKGAQEELFNIFNYYEQTGKFIAFTSDKSPDLLENFEPRLLTRFQGGLSAEIQAPNFATRMQILEFKQSKYGFYFSKEILNQIAASITNSVRSLEGALFKVGTYQKMKGSCISLEELSRLIPQSLISERNISVESILADSARTACLKVSDLKSNSRKREIVTARNQAMARMRDELELSYAEIGRIFMKDHSTIISSIKKYTKV